ncbi:ATP11-domain-containing protein [Clavulina sp. PMI_390]|nr:ATP11-domain-containing protein [Clavulina sp. PMI_390]
MATPHTADQISSLWLVYHGSRSNGTGRGYLSASMSRTQYDSMLARAKKYPIFIIPLQHTVPVEGGVEGETKEATEFYFLQWDLHEPPEVPSANTVDPAMGVDALLASKTSSSSSASEPASGSATRAPPHISTVILTPLQEYKLRSTYAQPRLVLTHYSNFANTHDTVLLRGEIAESSSSSGNYMLSQVEAQLLALAVQRFYLAVDEGQGKEVSGKAFQLLQDFHQRPESFDYEKLIELSPRI